MVEAIDAFVLFLFGCGTAVGAGSLVRVLSVALAFGFAVIVGARRWGLHLLPP